MEKCTGNNLINTFEELDVDIAKLNKNVIRGWFDTCCNDRNDLLAWLCTSFDKNELLTGLEYKEYEYLVNNNLVLPENNIENELALIQRKFPELLQVQNTKFEIEMMNDALNLHLQEEHDQEYLINMYEDVKRNFIKELNKMCKEEVNESLKKEKAYNNCFLIGRDLDDAHKKLQEIILRYKNNIDNFEYAMIPLFFATMDLEKYNEKYLDILRNEQMLEKNTFCDKLDSTCTLEIKNNTFNQIDELEVLQKRILNSNKKYLLKKIQQVQLEETLNQLKSQSTDNLNMSTDSSYALELEINIKERQEQIKIILKYLTGFITCLSSSLIFETKINFIRNNIEVKRQKLTHLNSIHEKINMVLRDQILIVVFHENVDDVIKGTFPFLRSVQHYINKNLQCCQFRTSAMLQTIKDHNVYKNSPLETNHALIKSIKSLLCDGEEKEYSLKEIFDLMMNFKAEKERVEYQLFETDHVNHRIFCKPMESDIDVLQTFLRSGPCNQILLVPYKLTQWFITIETYLKEQKNEIMLSVQTQAEAKKKLSGNKWMCMERNLWMYFIQEPKKLLLAIEEIKKATKNVV